MRTIDHNIAQNIVNTLYGYKVQLGPRKLQGLTGLYSKTFNFHVNRLISLGILIKREGLLSFTKEAKEQYEEGKLIIPSDQRARKNIINSVKTAKKIRIKRHTKQYREKKERLENIYLQIVSLAAFGAGYFERQSNAEQLGLLCYYDYFNKKTLYYRGFKLNGVAISDLATKGRTKTDYLPNKRRNLVLGELFSYINLSKSEAEEYIKRLQNHNPPILNLIDSHSTVELRYEIADATLKHFIIDCLVTLFDVCSMMRYIWTYERRIRTDEKQWYNRLFGKEGKGIKTAGEYASSLKKTQGA